MAALQSKGINSLTIHVESDNRSPSRNGTTLTVGVEYLRSLDYNAVKEMIIDFYNPLLAQLFKQLDSSKETVRLANANRFSVTQG
ncbi:MAG: hypothetical protein LBG10_08235 [Treponema sp.]|jgi:hypothetical protein|nr:hypothetical protein [Treponema sp.]